MSANRPDEEDKDRHLEEEVDESLEESFPASDPPSRTLGREKLPERIETSGGKGKAQSMYAEKRMAKTRRPEN